MNNDTGNEYFSDGIAEEIINSIAKIAGLQLTSRTYAFSFKGKKQVIRKKVRRLT